MSLFIADVGKGKLHVYDSGKDIFHGNLPKDDLINMRIPGIQSGDTVVIEKTHMHEAHDNTLAQAYSFDKLEELKKIADNIGVKIKLCPQQSTPKARKLYGVEESGKTDEIDTRAIANFLLEDTNAFRTLTPFSPIKMVDFQEKNQHIFDYIKEANKDINPAKSSESGYGLDPKCDHYNDGVSNWIKKHTVDGGSSLYGYTPTIADYLDYDEELLYASGLFLDKKTNNLKIIKPMWIYTLTTTILRPNGSLRLRKDNGLPPYWKYVKANLLGCKPNHMKQGVIASNYKKYMRVTISEYAFPDKKSTKSSDFQVGMSYEEYFKLKKARSKVDKTTQRIWCALRKMIVEDGIR